MTDEAVITGSYADLRLIKTRKVAVVCIEIPLERVPELIQKFGMPDYGAEVPVAVARLNGAVAQPTEQYQGTDAGENPASPAKPKSYAQRAGILSNDPVFWHFLYEKGWATANADDAANVIRIICDVKSRRDLIEGTDAGRMFLDLVAEFEGWKQL